MARDTASAPQPEASPHRHRAAPWELVAALAGGTVAWGVALVATYGLVDVACYPGLVPVGPRVPAWSTASAVALVVYVVALAGALAAAWLAWRLWQRTRHEREAGTAAALEVGEGRTRFLALWGIAFDLTFATAILVHIVSLLVVSGCAAWS